MKTGPQLNVSSDRLEKPGVEPENPSLQGEWLIHYTTAAPFWVLKSIQNLCFHGERKKTEHPEFHLIMGYAMPPYL